VAAVEVDYPNLHKFARAAHEFGVYIAANTDSLINYGERYRAGVRRGDPGLSIERSEMANVRGSLDPASGPDLRSRWR
jgi:hypothetical protein